MFLPGPEDLCRCGRVPGRVAEQAPVQEHLGQLPVHLQPGLRRVPPSVAPTRDTSKRWAKGMIDLKCAGLYLRYAYMGNWS